ncbi:hypothetical protein VTK26DRAFT_2887 [Humicola hyalothermophila]
MSHRPPFKILGPCYQPCLQLPSPLGIGAIVSREGPRTPPRPPPWWSKTLALGQHALAAVEEAGEKELSDNVLVAGQLSPFGLFRPRGNILQRALLNSPPPWPAEN